MGVVHATLVVQGNAKPPTRQSVSMMCPFFCGNSKTSVPGFSLIVVADLKEPPKAECAGFDHGDFHILNFRKLRCKMAKLAHCRRA